MPSGQLFYTALLALLWEVFSNPSKLGSIFMALLTEMAAQAALPPPCTSGGARHIAEPCMLSAEPNTASYKGEEQ